MWGQAKCYTRQDFTIIFSLYILINHWRVLQVHFVSILRTWDMITLAMFMYITRSLLNPSTSRVWPSISISLIHGQFDRHLHDLEPWSFKTSYICFIIHNYLLINEVGIKFNDHLWVVVPFRCFLFVLKMCPGSVPIWNNPFTGQVRLQGGKFHSQGRVEIYCNGEWGTICAGGFEEDDARVICQQLGYSDQQQFNSLTE